MKKLYVILIVVIVAIVAIAAYVLNDVMAPREKVSSKAVDEVLTVEKLADSVRSNSDRLDELFNKSGIKVISLKGKVESADTSEGKFTNVYFEEGDVSIQCTMEQGMYSASEAPAPGAEISVKGELIGVDELLGLEVKINNCILQE